MSTSLYLCCMQWFLPADWLRQENKKLNVQIISSGKMYCFESLVCRSTINACSASQMVMKVDTFFKQIFLPVWGNRSIQRKPTTFDSGLTHFNNPTPILQREIRFLTFTSLKYLSCFLCYLGIYRKPVISTGGKFVWACASKMSHAIAWNTRNACLQKGTIV
jgi:hypothetical protein